MMYAIFFMIVAIYANDKASKGNQVFSLINYIIGYGIGLWLFISKLETLLLNN